MKRLNRHHDPAALHGNKQDRKVDLIHWHPAFVEALQQELKAYKDVLEFFPEYQLTAEPLRIDCVVIKKAKNVVIEKNIAAIFREINLLEYKSPDDYISVADFYKVYGYACLYAALEKVPVSGMTISFVESHNPRVVLAHLQKIRRYKVEETSPGIYTIEGDILPIQILDSRQLSADENLWLRLMGNNLDAYELARVLSRVFGQGKGTKIGAYLDAISRANKEILPEAIKMTVTEFPVLEEALEKAGLFAKVEARAKEQKAINIAKNLINLGFPPDTVASVTELEIEKVKTLYQG